MHHDGEEEELFTDLSGTYTASVWSFLYLSLREISVFEFVQLEWIFGSY